MASSSNISEADALAFNNKPFQIFQCRSKVATEVAPIEQVKVYKAQAEVTRIVHLSKSLHLGEQYIVLQGVPKTLNEQTIRAAPVILDAAASTTQLPFSVLEVSFRKRNIEVEDRVLASKQEENKQKIASLENDIKALKEQHLAITNELARSNVCLLYW